MTDTRNIYSREDYIPDSGCFTRLTAEETDYLNKNKSTLVYHANETVCKAGGFASGVKYIIDGLIKIYIEGPGNRNIIVKILGPGDFIGLTSLSGRRIYSYSATALSDSTVFMINRDAVLELIRKNGEFALEITDWYCISYEKAYKKLATIGFKNLPGKIADVLLYLEQDKFKSGNIYSYLNRSCIAELAGVPVESAVRILSEFDKEGIIELEGKKIRIRDMEKLETYSRKG